MKYAPVKARHDGTIEVEHLQDILPSLVLRLDHRAVDELERSLAHAREPDSIPQGVSTLAWLLWHGLLDVVAKQSRALELCQQDWRAFTQRHALLSDEQGRQHVIMDYIDTHTRGMVSRFLDRRAARDTLDLDALQERQTLTESHLIATIRVACIGLEELGHILIARIDSNLRSALVREGMLNDSGIDVLRDWVESGRDPELAWLALRSLQPALEHSFAQTSERVAPGWLRVLAGWLASPQTSSWMQITALEILSAAPHNGAAILEEHLRTLRDTKDHWHTRAHAARKLAMRFPEHAAGMLDVVFEHEPHDGVLIAALNALDPEVEAVHALVPSIKALLLAPATHTPPTRAAAASTLGRFARHGDTLAAAALVEHLSQEQDTDVLHVSFDALHDALAIRQTHADLSGLIEGVVRALNQRIAMEQDAGASHELTRIRLRLRALVASTEEDDLLGKMDNLEAGDAIIIDGEVSIAELSRAMQRATSGRYGLYAKHHAKGWRVERGERLGFKPWRVLHELRHPSPNKRQDTSHSHGRRYGGWLRAHSDALGEVTPTTVPGERRMIREEGGWGAYLPLVDDLLDAQNPWQEDGITLVSEAGLTHITPPTKKLVRLKNYLYLSWHYERFDLKRSQALRGQDAAQRGNYLEDIEAVLGVQVTFEPHAAQDAISAPLLGLFSETAQGPKLLEAHRPVAAQLAHEPRAEPIVALPLLAATGDWLLGPLREVSTQLGDRLFSRGQVRGQELLIVMFAALLSFVMRMVWVRVQVDRWRKRIPLSVGGWGTRGKSGTERLKAGMFQGLGYDVFVKTTGCEAMFIHAPRRSTAREIFIYRPYDKASIWEQRDMLGLGQAMNSDVFLWECMALNPRYVEILQSIWMRDDIVTLTNAYPDHEDIQGPTGADVARTISRFIPKQRMVITAEREMLPVLRERARAQKSALITVGPHDELALSHDALARFPYSEHPRNIALVKRLAIELGVDPEFAVFAMADDVVPDLGVLKVYPDVRLLGRTLTFINGCSANERAGFMNNWFRMNLHELNPRTQPERVVVTVVNNRDDRIARSRVFADILVSDIAFDHHILIGTNLSGLRTYMDEALDDLLEGLVIVEPPEEDERIEEVAKRSERRLRALIERVRLIDHDAAWCATRLSHMARACMSDDPEAELIISQDILHDLITADLETTSTLEACHAHITAHTEFTHLVEHVHTLIAPLDESVGEGHPDRIERAPAEAFATHAATQLATVRMAHALHHALRHALDDLASRDILHERVARTFRDRFWRMVVTVEDAQASGDTIIARVAQSVAPGSDVQIMGTQNIKGTGLDFVYRWVELGETMREIEVVHPARREAFQDTMVGLGSTDAIKLVEALNLRRYLLALREKMALGARDQSLVQRAIEHLEALTARRWRDAQPRQGAQKTGLRDRLISEMEMWLDPLDAIWRRRHAEHLQRLFVARRISHKRMASEMQKLNKRQKGGWLFKKPQS